MKIDDKCYHVTAGGKNILKKKKIERKCDKL